jgi:hypothetical protein
VNDPERLAAICSTCNEQKTPKDLKEIARTKRLAEAHQDFLERQRDKVPGRPVPSRNKRQQFQRALAYALLQMTSTVPDTEPDRRADAPTSRSGQ